MYYSIKYTPYMSLTMYTLNKVILKLVYLLKSAFDFTIHGDTSSLSNTKIKLVTRMH